MENILGELRARETPDVSERDCIPSDDQLRTLLAEILLAGSIEECLPATLAENSWQYHLVRLLKLMHNTATIPLFETPEQLHRIQERLRVIDESFKLNLPGSEPEFDQLIRLGKAVANGHEKVDRIKTAVDGSSTSSVEWHCLLAVKAGQGFIDRMVELKEMETVLVPDIVEAEMPPRVLLKNILLACPIREIFWPSVWNNAELKEWQTLLIELLRHLHKISNSDFVANLEQIKKDVIEIMKEVNHDLMDNHAIHAKKVDLEKLRSMGQMASFKNLAEIHYTVAHIEFTENLCACFSTVKYDQPVLHTYRCLLAATAGESYLRNNSG
ncbi:hypothetical protein Ciccas_013749, partial [Cichlidogyrus casuarinus]